jgi:hypothetical protein
VADREWSTQLDLPRPGGEQLPALLDSFLRRRLAEIAQHRFERGSPEGLNKLGSSNLAVLDRET